MRPERTAFTQPLAKGDFMNAVPVLTATKVCSRCYWKGVHDIMLLDISRIYSRYLLNSIIADIYRMSSIYLLKRRNIMGKNLEKQYAFRCDDETIKKLEYIAAQHTRTRNQEMKHIIKQYVDAWEEDHGKINVEE